MTRSQRLLLELMLRIHPISTRGRSFPALGPSPVLWTVETEHPVRHKCVSPRSLKAKHRRTRGLSAPGPYNIRWLLFLTLPVVKTHKLSPPLVLQSRKHGTEGAGLTSGSLRQQSLVKARCGNTPVYIANMSRQPPEGRGWGETLPPLSSSADGSAAPCTSSKVHCLVGSSSAQAHSQVCAV